jgi:putative membrane protein
MKRLRAISILLLSSACAFALAQDNAASRLGPAGGPSDRQITGVMIAANQVDIDAGKLAKSRSKNKEVVAFAQSVIADSTAVNKQTFELMKKLKVKLTESDTSRSLRGSGKETLAKLKELKGEDFDKAYADNQAAYHQQVLDMIDTDLIPSAQNAGLKDLLAKVRPAMAAHLDRVKTLQSSFGKKEAAKP